jgi:hypothetical protein
LEPFQEQSHVGASVSPHSPFALLSATALNFAS